MVTVKMSDIMSRSITFENVLYIRVLEWLVILVGCKINGINQRQENLIICLILFTIIQEVEIKIFKQENKFSFFRDIL